MSTNPRTMSSTAKNLLGSIDQIAARRQAVLNRWSEFKEVASQRRQKLEDSKKLQQFYRNCEELENWINSKLAIASDESHKDTTNLQGKIKKHKTFVAEINANENALSTLEVSGNELINANHFASESIAAKIEAIKELWALLALKSKEKATKLQEMQSLITFKREADEVEAWIQGKLNIAGSKDVGKDLEHVAMLQKKFDDFSTDVAASDGRLDAFNSTAIELIKAGHPESALINTRQQEINSLWSSLKKQTAARMELLANARQVHTFTRDADEVDSRISEKASLLITDDYGKDLASVDALQRKHEAFSRDLAALGDSVTALTEDARRLSTAFPAESSTIREKRDAVAANWDKLSSAAKQRKTKLDDSYALQKFLNDLQTSLSWLGDMTVLVTSDELARDVAGAEALLQRHQERYDEIQARQATFSAVVEFGNSLVLRGHYASSEIQAKLDDLKAQRDDLNDLWAARQTEFTECHSLQTFLRNAEQVESWMASRESVVQTSDVGDSLDTAEALMKKHDDFEKSLAAYSEKMDDLLASAETLIAQGHGSADDIKARRDAVKARRQSLDTLSTKRREDINSSKLFQKFKRNADETEAWIKEKLQTATDPSYNDPSNLRGKIKNHEAFAAEIQANKSRLTTIDAFGGDLVSQSHPAADPISSNLTALKTLWDELQAESDAKYKRLQEAYQMQEFLRRVEDMGIWCQDVEKALASEDVGKDLTSVDNLLKKQQLLEADVAGHKKRMEDIVASAEEMVAAGNFQAEAIQAKQQALEQRYAAFEAPMKQRRARLEESLSLQQFLRQIEDELSWINEKEALATSQNYGTSLIAVQNLQKKHNALLAELTGHQSHIQAAEKQAQQLIAASHFASEKIAQRRDDLVAKWRALNSAAQTRRGRLDDALQVQEFFANINEAQAWMAEKEPIVGSDNYGKDEDSSVALFKKHEAVEQDIRAYKGDIERLAADCTKCQAKCADSAAAPTSSSTQEAEETSAPPSSDAATETVSMVLASHTFDAKGDARKISLQKGEKAKLLSKDSADWWRCEKDGKIGFVPAAYMTEFTEEVPTAAKAPTATTPTTTSAPSSPTKTSQPAVASASAKDIAARQHAIEAQYQSLVDQAALRRKRLKETQELFQFNRELDEVESWMNTREAIASAEDLGSDLEHNESIQNKFGDFQKDLVANESRVQVANKLADGLLASGHTDSSAIDGRRKALNDRWDKLQALAADRSAKLFAAQEIHRFNHDVEDTKSRFHEKDIVVSSDDYGKDISSVEALQRKHDAAMRDLTALDAKVAELSKEADRLQGTYPDTAQDVKDKMASVMEGWNALQAKAEARKLKLAESLDYQKFLSEHHDLMSWLSGTKNLASSSELASDATGAQNLLRRHQDIQVDIDCRADDIEKLRSFGKQLIANGHGQQDDMQLRLDTLNQELEALAAQMADRKQQLEQCLELQSFNRLAEQVGAWITTREAPLLSEEVGTTLDAVAAMQKKHTDFENSLAAQTEKVNEVKAEADRLVGGDHYDAMKISERKHALVSRWDRLLELAEQRKKKLAQAMSVQQFHRDADEAEAWIVEKMQVASDPSYQDPSNLQGKAQKHQTFSGEVTANEGRVYSVIDTGKRVKDESPAHADEVQTRIDSLEGLWKELTEKSKDKAQKLQEASSQEVFNHKIDDVEFWLSEVELQLASQDLGKDLPAVQALISKHNLVEADIAAHQDRMDQVRKQAQEFEEAGHFDLASIKNREQQVVERFTDVQTLALERRQKLQASLELQRVLRSIDDEEAWIQEKERVAASTDYGKDLTGVQNLQKKHINFETELENHEPRIQAAVDAANELIAASHYASSEAEERRTSLEQAWSNLKILSKQRGDMIAQSLAYQQFRSSVDEEESWINEKYAMISTSQAVDTLSGAQSLSKKHDAFEVDLEEHKERVSAIQQNGETLLAQKNFKAAEIDASLVSISGALSKLQAASAERKQALFDRLAFLKFSREADSITTWIRDKEPQASLADYGKDLTAAQAYIAKHDTFDAAVGAFSGRVAEFLEHAEQLAKQGGDDSKSAILAREAAVSQQWEALLSASANRRAMLEKTQQTYQQIDDLFLEFAQKASQFNSWFENAEEDLTDPVRVNSLEEIQALRTSHAQFMQSLESTEEKFAELKALQERIASYTQARNPYTWFTIETLHDSWTDLENAIEERTADLQLELKRQEDNEVLRQKFAKRANEFSAWLSKTRAELVEGTGTLEEQLETTKAHYGRVTQWKQNLKEIEDLGARMEENLILDNKYTEHTTVSLAQQWDQLEQLGMRMQHNLEQQIQAKNSTGVDEEKLGEFREAFRFFDKDSSGYLEHQEFKGCLRSLGMNFAVVEEGETDPEFQAILDSVDPNRDGKVDMNEFMAFMISRATENVESSSEVINAFRAAAGEKPFITVEDLSAILSPEQVDYCVRHMARYVDPSGQEVSEALDYTNFTQDIFSV